VVLLDTSGSMSGEPLAQAKRVVSALVASLSEHDSLEMVEFSSAPRRWQTDAVKMTAQNARAAQSWLAGLRASGGTEMRAGIFEAMRTLRVDAQRQILLVTDGLIGFESEIVAAVRRELPQSCRVHALGIGHGVNRSLTGPAARAGGGVEVIVAPGEDVEPVVARLLARTCSPQLVDLEISGTAVRGHAPVRIPDLFAGCPTRIALELDPAGGSLVVRGRRAGGGHHVQELVVPATDAGHGNAAIVRAWARERVEDLETALASGEVKGVIDAEIERIGLGFAISTRLTAWVAVSDQIDVDPTSPTRRERMPHELAAGMSIEGLGLRGAREEQTRFSMAVMAAPQGAAYAGAVPGAGPASMAPPSPARPKTKAAAGPLGMLRRFLPGRGRVTDDETPDLGERAAAAEEETVDELELAAEKFEVRGRIVLAEDGRVIVEVDAGEGFAWQPGTRVTLELADGRRIEVEIDPTSTSRASSLARGTTARLAVRTSEPANTIVAIELADAANTRIRIE
jgi:Ca-activated chloride channel family protein